jgi:hypothetical protein
MSHLARSIFYGFQFEQQPKFYKKIGVHHFKKILPGGDYWIRLYNFLLSKNEKEIKSKQDARKWVVLTMVFESAHFLSFLIVTITIILDLIDASYLQALKTTGMNVVVNVFPIFVQRYNRTRILKIFNLSYNDVKNFKIKI